MMKSENREKKKKNIEPFFVFIFNLVSFLSQQHSSKYSYIHFTMIPTRILLNGAKNVKPKLTYPVELTPLFAAVGVALVSATFSLTDISLTIRN